MAVGLAIALAVTFFSPLADPNPDGLEKVAEEKGFLEEGESPVYEILPDYTVPLIKNEAATTIAAGIIGVLIVAGIGYGTGRANKRVSL
ncbi:MAG: PDGLE domain-containing protein [Anaerolineae bacterium]|nr:PDGLE domain-containing protein [Anaerolineae bacterium]